MEKNRLIYGYILKVCPAAPTAIFILTAPFTDCQICQTQDSISSVYHRIVHAPTVFRKTNTIASSLECVNPGPHYRQWPNSPS
ncbi:hypothetical protein DSUL_30028 [Desulfovibrionales bacterium]